MRINSRWVEIHEVLPVGLTPGARARSTHGICPECLDRELTLLAQV